MFTVSCCRPNTRPPGAARSKVIAVTGQLCGQTQFDDAVGKLSGGVLPTARYADRPAPVVATVVPVSVPEYTPLHDRRSTCQAKIRLPGCAIARSSRSVCKSGYGAPRSRPSRSAICIKTAAMTLCAYRARAAAVTRWRSTRRPLRLRTYLERAGHGVDSRGALVTAAQTQRQAARATPRHGSDAIDRVVRRYAAALGLDRGYSAHSMRATFITTALENGAQLEDVQKAAGHRDPSTTKLYEALCR